MRHWAAVWLPRAVDCLVTGLVVAGFALVVLGLHLGDAWRRVRTSGR